MTDNEIIKALECCGIKHCCEECPYKGVKCKLMNGVLSDALDLINRQQAEIERLNSPVLIIDNVDLSENEIAEKLRNLPVQIFPDNEEQIRNEAIKDVVEKLRKHIEALEYNLNTPRKTVPVQTLYDQVNWILKEVIPQTIDGVLKELEGDAE